MVVYISKPDDRELAKIARMSVSDMLVKTGLTQGQWGSLKKKCLRTVKKHLDLSVPYEQQNRQRLEEVALLVYVSRSIIIDGTNADSQVETDLGFLEPYIKGWPVDVYVRRYFAELFRIDRHQDRRGVARRSGVVGKSDQIHVHKVLDLTVVEVKQSFTRKSVGHPPNVVPQSTGGESSNGASSVLDAGPLDGVLSSQNKRIKDYRFLKDRLAHLGIRNELDVRNLTSTGRYRTLEFLSGKAKFLGIEDSDVFVLGDRFMLL
ncbi:hypothetical protein CONPUDRAFT_147909 [Coniophora puteana RWD-64-598 SS2]|uniref:Uncharacterized protein n=1 Tax=Coniophora puteana (strain RWD-64-598) TaxID=741705 RepID=R7SE56_CONPW|nr:uncharacterized protein CONPUDRAFT_147909 [Coniophora puteana RWD-64-598 SS2]EIW74140.1 hypothetical protein CONPUDRAFT_147909 [Coniophora puteana RWD-64-598 SS2]